MQVAVQFDLSNMPAGISRQNDIGSPMTRISTPAWRRCAAAASPYGPAPRMATSVSDMDPNFPGCYSTVARRGRPVPTIGAGLGTYGVRAGTRHARPG